MSEEEEARQPGEGRLPLEAVAVLILLILIGTAAGIVRKGGGTVAGDQALKLELIQRYKQPSHGHRKNWLEQAFKEYRDAANEDPTPATIRRWAIVAAETGRPIDPILRRLTSPEVTKGLSGAALRRIRQEARMWSEIYGIRSVPPSRVPSYRKQIEEMGLGPAKWLALEHMYRAANQPEKAALAARCGEERAVRAMKGAFGITAFWVLMGIAGGIFILPAIIARRGELMARSNDLPPGKMPSPQTLWSSLAVFLVLFAIFQLLGGAIAASLDARYGVLALFSAYVSAGGIGMIWLLRRVLKEGADLAAIGFFSRNTARDVLTGAASYAATLPFVGAALLIVLAGERILPGLRSPVHPVAPLVGEVMGSPILILLLILVALMAPFFEETFFRGVLFNALRSRFSATGSVLFSSIAFAAIHPQLPLGFLPIFALGAGFAATFAVTKSLIPCMVAHNLNNMLTFLVAMLMLGS